MTTIAYRDGVLAGDTMVSCGDTRTPECCSKVFKLASGALFGCAGSREQWDELRHAVVNGHPTPVLKKAEALLIHPDGTVYEYEGLRWVKVGPAPYAALGSGHNFALAAMWMGADAIKAVQAGIAFDKNSGGPVQNVRLSKRRK